MNVVAPSVKLALPLDPLELPFSVPVDRRLNYRDVQQLLRDTYSDTEFDASKGVFAGPFGSPFRHNLPMNSSGQLARTVATRVSQYGVLGHPRRSDHAVMWFAADAPITSVFVPFYVAAGDAKDGAYSRGLTNVFSRDSAWWAFNFVNNWMEP